MLYTRQDTVLWSATAFYSNGSSKCCTQMCVNSFSTVVQDVIATRQQRRFHPIWHVPVCVKQAIVAVVRAKGWTGWQVQSQCARGLSDVSDNKTADNHPTCLTNQNLIVLYFLSFTPNDQFWSLICLHSLAFSDFFSKSMLHTPLPFLSLDYCLISDIQNIMSFGILYFLDPQIWSSVLF